MKVGKPEWNIYIYVYLNLPHTISSICTAAQQFPQFPFILQPTAQPTAGLGAFSLLGAGQASDGGLAEVLYIVGFVDCFCRLPDFRHIYIYICPSSAIDRALVSSMSVYIFYLYGTPVPFMLQEATQPTAEQKKAGGQEQGLKDCCDRTSEWKFGQPQKDPGNTVYKYIYIYTHV